MPSAPRSEISFSSPPPYASFLFPFLVPPSDLLTAALGGNGGGGRRKGKRGGGRRGFFSDPPSPVRSDVMGRGGGEKATKAKGETAKGE